MIHLMYYHNCLSHIHTVIVTITGKAYEEVYDLWMTSLWVVMRRIQEVWHGMYYMAIVTYYIYIIIIVMMVIVHNVAYLIVSEAMSCYTPACINDVTLYILLLLMSHLDTIIILIIVSAELKVILCLVSLCCYTSCITSE